MKTVSLSLLRQLRMPEKTFPCPLRCEIGVGKRHSFLLRKKQTYFCSSAVYCHPTVVKLEEKQRRYRRFQLAAPVAFKWCESAGVAREGVGYSQDVSVGGIFIRAARCTPPIRSVLRYEVLLPSINRSGACVRIKAAGRVLRTKALKDGKKYHGFAVQSRKALFCLA